MHIADVIKRAVVFPAVICLAAKFSSGQPSAYRFENITNEQGIADRVINAIAQDAQGFIWIASVDGLTRYDGYNAVVYRHQANNAFSISDNEVYALCTDGSGHLWIGTRNGLNRYDAENDRFETFLYDSTDKNSLAANEIFSLAKDPHGDLWIGTYNGGIDKLVKTVRGGGYRRSGYSFLHYRYNEKDSNSISNDQVFSICFDKEGNAWAGTTNGVSIIGKQTKKIARLYADRDNANTMANKTVNKIVAAKDGTVWLCGNNMLDNVSVQQSDNNARFSVKHYLPLLTGAGDKNEWAINDFMIDRYNNCWVATNDKGVLKFTKDKEGKISSVENFISGPSSFNLVNKTVFSFYEDNAGVVWIGTAKGISQYIPSKAKFDAAGFLPVSYSGDQFVNALLYDDKKRLWLGSDFDSLTVINDGKMYPLALPFPGNRFNQVNTFYQSKTGDIYAGTFAGGLFVIPGNLKNAWDTRFWTHIISGLPSKNIYAITEDKQGIIWLGTYKGLCSYDPKTKKLNNVYVPPGKNIVSAFIIRTVFTDENNVVWCGTDEGLILIKDNKVVQKFFSDDSDSNSLNNNRVTVIYGDDKRNIWIGTKSGLNLFDAARNNFKHITSHGVMTDETVMSIQKDKAGNLWIGTNNGLIKFNIKQNIFIKYTVEDGLCSNEFVINASCSNNSDGCFYFGTANGLVSFNPSHIVSNDFIPPVVITGVNVLDESIASLHDTSIINTYRREKKLVLKYDQNFFSFEFAALSYNNSKANRFAYMLEGVDRQWRHSGMQHFANYTDIRPGHYTFKVKASNNDGIWNNEPAMVVVVISPPWWGTWWFYSLFFLVACSIIYMVYRIRIQQILKLYKLRSSIAKDLHDDVGSALSSIALLSNISQEAKTKARLEPEQIFSRIGDTSKRMIGLMDDIVWSVNPDNDRFSNMLVRMREYAAEMLESKDIDFSFHVADDIDELRIPMQLRKDYFLIFKEAINNLAKCSDCRNARINIEKFNKNIITSIADDGKGFDPQIINSGNGLKNMQQRAMAIKAKLNIETVLGRGTTITLSMPV